MVPVLALTVFALLLSRVMRAPAGTWRYVLGAAAAALVGSQLLPEGNAWRADVAGSARVLFWVGLGLAPVAAYAVVLRALRQRTGATDAVRPTAPSARGLVQFADDAALAAETAAALMVDTETARRGERLSLGWRGADGALEGHLRLRLDGDLVEIEMLRVAPKVRRRGVGAGLLQAGESEAAVRGARRIGALVGDWQTPEFFERAGYGAQAGAGPRRRWMEKAL